MIFHRILSDFLVQTGLTTDGKTLSGSTSGSGGGSNNSMLMDRYLRSSSAALSGGSSSLGGGGGDALGLDRKKLEVNPRIRFNHRGQVALAFPLDENMSSNDKDGNAHNNDDEETAMLRHQFFITLDEAPFLDAKHVLFGTVAGPTMFNALRIGRTDSDEKSGIPVDIMEDPPRIKSVKVNYHPFDDLVVTSDDKIPWKKKASEGGGGGKQQSAMEIRRKKRKGKRDYNVLSFGDEERDYEEEITAADEGSKKKKSGAMLSSHDVLSSSRTAIHQDSIIDDDDVHTAKKRDIKSEHSMEESNEIVSEEYEESRSTMNGSESKHISNGVPTRRENIAALHNSVSDDGKQIKKETAKSVGLSAVEARRAKYLKSGSGSSANKKERLKREGDTMARLSAFKSKVIETTKGRDTDDDKATQHPMDNSLASRMAERAKKTKEEEDIRKEEEDAFKALPGYSGQVIQANDDNNWMGTKFKCKRHMDNDSRMASMDKIDEDRIGGDGRRMDDYMVLDDKTRRQGKRAK